MKDIRIERWAKILVNYSLEAKPGQHAVIIGEPEAMPLFEACYEELIKAGAITEAFIIPSSLKELYFRNASDEQIATPPPVMKYIAEHCDLYMMLGADANTKLLSNFDPHKQALASQARLPFMSSIMKRAAEKKMRWVYTHFPTAAAAQDAEMGTREYEELVYKLGFLNEEDPIKMWNQVEASQQTIINYLEAKKELHFKNDQGTDLKVNIEGMKWVNCCGRINFPDGEVYTGPNLMAPDGGVNGIARYSFPTLYRNVEVHDIEIEFKNGAVASAKASKGEDFLKKMIALDEGSKYVGEIAIGTNYHMQHITKNILFDEKFGGTFHFALGKGYPQTGNTNHSALHWDIIFDLRKGGSIAADGEIFFKNGQFLQMEWQKR